MTEFAARVRRVSCPAGLRNAPALPMLAVILGEVFWGVSNIFTKVALNVADMYTLLSVRFVTAMLVMSLPLIFGEKKHTLRNLLKKGRYVWLLVSFSILEAVYFFLESYAIQETNASFAGMGTALIPLFATFFAAAFLREIPPLRQLLFSLLPILGILLISVSGASVGVVNARGLIALLLCCATAGIMRTLNRKAALYFDSFERTYTMLIACCLAFTFMALWTNHGDVGIYARALAHWQLFTLPVLVLVLFCSIGSNLLVNFATGRMSVLMLSAFSAVCPLVAMASGFFFLHEPITPMIVVGAALILYGIYEISKAS